MSNLSLNTGLRALLSARYVLDTIGHNIANANTTRDAQGNPSPYGRLEVLFASKEGGSEGRGVKVTAVRPAAVPHRWVHEPEHPDAVRDPQSEHYGQVLMPNVSIVQEMVDMMLASRAYEANLAAIQVTKAIGTAVSEIIA